MISLPAGAAPGWRAAVARTPAEGGGRPLPTGTVTVLMSDIEGSTRLFHRFGSDYVALLTEHRRLLRDAVAVMAMKAPSGSGVSGAAGGRRGRG